MNDAAGNKLRPGDRVIVLYRSGDSASLRMADVVGFTPMMVYVRYDGFGDGKYLKDPSLVCKRWYPGS